MSDRFRKKARLPQTMHVAIKSVQRQVAAWLAILALYLQIAATGLCTCGLPVLTNAGMGPGAFPICHSQSSGQAQDDDAPAHHHQQDCPYCTAHCHAAMVVTPSISGLDSIYAVATTTVVLPFIVPQAARFPAGAPPRGPPASA